MTFDDLDIKNRNITISGLPGGGSTTLMNLLKNELKFDGWKGFSGGEFMRVYAIEKGRFKDGKLHHDATTYEDDFDRQIDFGMREKLRSEEKWILESWMSGFFAQGIDGVYKILVKCSEDSVRVDRIVNRDNVSVEKAKKHIVERYNENVKKWRRMYADEWRKWVIDRGLATAEEPIDFWKESLYDLVIDTYSHNQEETLKIALDAIQKK